ncbi:MAG: hypothetical protein JWN15_1773 [Firmicutes bacterium]|nr:hypothetical protein [Bacillota bacterium]
MKQLCALVGIAVVLTGCAATGKGLGPVGTPATDNPPATWNAKQAHLVSPATGWVLVTSGTIQGMVVVHTVDAGAHWQLVSRGGGPGGTPTAQHLPNTEYVTGVTFRTAAEGWVTARYRTTNDVALYHTADAGRTWQRQPIAYPDTGSKIHYCDAFPPQFIGADRTAGVLVLQCRGTPEPGWVAVYRAMTLSLPTRGGRSLIRGICR